MCPGCHGAGEGVPVHGLLSMVVTMGNYGILNPCLVSSVSHHGVGLAAGLSVGDVGRVQGQGLQT